MENKINLKEVYLYEISGYYFAGDERKSFRKEVYAMSNTEAMEIVIGQLAWKESNEGNSFELDVIHYE